MRELGSRVSGHGNDLGPDAAGDVRDLDRAHRRAGVRHDEDRIPVADDRGDRLPDEVAVNPELAHPHRARAGGDGASPDAVDEQLLRAPQAPDRLSNPLATVNPDELAAM